MSAHKIKLSCAGLQRGDAGRLLQELLPETRDVVGDSLPIERYFLPLLDNGKALMFGDMWHVPPGGFCLFVEGVEPVEVNGIVSRYFETLSGFAPGVPALIYMPARLELYPPTCHCFSSDMHTASEAGLALGAYSPEALA